MLKEYVERMLKVVASCTTVDQLFTLRNIITPGRISQGHVQNGRRATFCGPICVSFCTIQLEERFLGAMFDLRIIVMEKFVI
jgi:hypothetical protein